MKLNSPSHEHNHLATHLTVARHMIQVATIVDSAVGVDETTLHRNVSLGAEELSPFRVDAHLSIALRIWSHPETPQKGAPRLVTPVPCKCSRPMSPQAPVFAQEAQPVQSTRPEPHRRNRPCP